MDKPMSSLLKWSIENAVPADSTSDETAANTQQRAQQSLDTEALRRLLAGAPSDAELMKAAMEVIRDPETTLENKLIAFDNFEQLVENLDNANNMEPLGLWTPLVEELRATEAERRMMAAWCIGTAVQNNLKAQERLLVVDAVPILLQLSQADPDTSVRRKAAYALSSAVRNYQPALDQLHKHLPVHIATADEKLDASDMERINEIITKLKES